MADNQQRSAIASFFSAKSVFITGATGFVGKQIIEKLLRSCPDVKHIYILVRSKRGLNVTERVHQLCSLALFDRVRLSTPDFESKIIPIVGDITKPRFDLSDDHEELLTENCQIVINSGASVRFTDPLKQAIKSNLLSVQNIIDLCRKMKQLQSCVHISTAYIHCYRVDIDEIIYATNENPSLILQSTEWFDEDIFDGLSGKLLKEFPNTYTYTKSLAEYLILQQASDLPFAIIRPSIIGAAWKEPIPGWIDSYSGVTNVIVTIGKRLLRTVLSDSKVDHPMIPVDTVANMTISIAWFTATNKNPSPLPSVYNCCTGKNNKTCLNHRDFFQTIISEEIAIGYENYSIVEPHLTVTLNKPYYYFRRFFGEVVPACLMDLAAYLTFRKASMVKLTKKINSLVRIMEYFSQSQWIFSDQNSRQLRNQMTDSDRQEFTFDLTQLNWSSYIRNYCIGTKKYLLKEPLPEAPIQRSHKKSLTRAKLIRYVLKISLVFLFMWLARKIFWKKLQVMKVVIQRMNRNYIQRRS